MQRQKNDKGLRRVLAFLREQHMEKAAMQSLASYCPIRDPGLRGFGPVTGGPVTRLNTTGTVQGGQSTEDFHLAVRLMAGLCGHGRHAVEEHDARII
ncbi:unnamed protein product [Merluccius merluccius]